MEIVQVEKDVWLKAREVSCIQSIEKKILGIFSRVQSIFALCKMFLMIFIGPVVLLSHIDHLCEKRKFLHHLFLKFFRFLQLSNTTEAHQFVEHFKNIELKRQVDLSLLVY
jgi:hypothetical protein